MHHQNRRQAQAWWGQSLDKLPLWPKQPRASYSSWHLHTHFGVLSVPFERHFCNKAKFRSTQGKTQRHYLWQIYHLIDRFINLTMDPLPIVKHILYFQHQPITSDTTHYLQQTVQKHLPSGTVSLCWQQPQPPPPPQDHCRKHHSHPACQMNCPKGKSLKKRFLGQSWSQSQESLGRNRANGGV